MNTAITPATKSSKGRLITGYVLSIVPAILLMAATSANFTQPEDVVKKTMEFGYAQQDMLPLGIVTVISLILLLIPRTAMIGALLVTGYLGGAVATHVIHHDGIVPILIPVIPALLIWIGLVLRSPKLNSLMPWGEGV